MIENDNSFFDSLEPEEKKEFTILFEDKVNWYIEDNNERRNWNRSKLRKFNKALKDFIKFQSDDYDLSYICFPMFNLQEGFFKNNTVDGNISFANAVFHDETYFVKTIFNGETNFSETIFLNTVSFNEAVFNQDANFNKSVFEQDVIFKNSMFKNKFAFTEVDFRGNAYLNAKNMSFNKIDLEGTYFEQPLLLGLSACEDGHKAPLEPKHFANRESARLIKDHFEKQNNITEANKYFRIEQELYIQDLQGKKDETAIDEIKQNNDCKSSMHSLEPNKIGTLISLYLNKLVSDFGTNWIRAILALIIWGFFVYTISELIQCVQEQDSCIKNALSPSTLSYLLTFPKNSTHINNLLGFSVLLIGIYIIYRATYYNTNYSIKKRILFIGIFLLWLLIVTLFFHQYQTLNKVAKILNPLNMFCNNSVFDGHQSLVLFVKAVTLAIIYQIIVAFRQNTRRK